MERQRKEVTRTKKTENGTEYCTLKVEIREFQGQKTLSICGNAGIVLTEKEAVKEARYLSYIINEDGEYAGLEVTKEEDGLVYIGQCWGQIREVISEYFPEAVKFYAFHLESPSSEVLAWFDSL